MTTMCILGVVPVDTIMERMHHMIIRTVIRMIIHMIMLMRPPEHKIMDQVVESTAAMLVVAMGTIVSLRVKAPMHIRLVVVVSSKQCMHTLIMHTNQTRLSLPSIAHAMVTMIMNIMHMVQLVGLLLVATIMAMIMIMDRTPMQYAATTMGVMAMTTRMTHMVMTMTTRTCGARLCMCWGTFCSLWAWQLQVL